VPDEARRRHREDVVEMMWGSQGSWWSMWLVMGAVVLALWALVAVAVVAVVRGVGTRDARSGAPDRTAPGATGEGGHR